jgi:hypothetical protein
MNTYLPRNAPGRTGEAQQKGGQEPVRQRSLALVEQSIGEVVEGALAPIAPVAFAPAARYADFCARLLPKIFCIFSTFNTRREVQTFARKFLLTVEG